MADGVSLDRVAAVIAAFQDGREQLGSGYLVRGDLVLTAAHCTYDKRTGASASRLRVVRATDGANVDVALADVVADPVLDVAALSLKDAPWADEVPQIAFARVDRTVTGILTDCAGIGYPLFQRDQTGNRDTSEFHGTIYQTDEAQSGRMLMREPLIHPTSNSVVDSSNASHESAAVSSAWGGLSGALTFFQGHAIGVVVEHHPRQGDSAIRMVGFDKIAAESAKIRQLLGLPDALQLPLVTSDPVVVLGNLVEILDGDDLPTVDKLNPYRLGATPTTYGDRSNYGNRDPYVPRTNHQVDVRVKEALQPRRLVLLVGPSKAGKTRTAFEAIRTRWPQARLLVPTPAGLPSLVTHQRLTSTADSVVLWLDDLQRFLTTSDPLTSAMINRIFARPGPTLIIATLRSEERARLRKDFGELSRDTRLLLEQAAPTTIDLAPTSEDRDEQAAAQLAYPDAHLSTAGLAEELAGAPALLQQYRDSQHEDQILHAVIQTAIDWVRVGMPKPIATDDLIDLARELLGALRPELEPNQIPMLAALKRARTPPAGAGRVAALRTILLPDQTRAYWPFEYLIAADDGQDGTARPIPSGFWGATMSRIEPEDVFALSVAAYQRQNTAIAIAASQEAAAASVTGAAYNLGILLSEVVDPPDIEAARFWYELAAGSGETSAMINLGVLLADLIDPPELNAARQWYEQAAAAGHIEGAYNLGLMLADHIEPPELEAARRWYEQAAAAGHVGAALNLGALLADRFEPPDLDAASRWWEQAATAGDVNAAYNLGILLADKFNPPDLDSARRWYEQAATAGHVQAANNLGTLLADQVNPPDLESARRWYERAAAGGHTDAGYSLGFMFSNQIDPPDLNAARRWYEQAATAGNTNAAYNLGVLLAVRIDRPDLDAARRWWEQAAIGGHTDAAYNLGVLFADHDPSDLNAASRWWEQAATDGHTDAAYRLGVLFSTRFDPPHLDAALRWYEQAATGGHTDAAYNLGLLLEDPLNTLDLDAVRRWYEQAATAGHTDAAYNLGLLLVLQLEPPDLDAARRWWEQAASNGVTLAAYNLGLLLATQIDPPDVEAARHWWEQAALAGNTNAMINLSILLTNQLDPPDLDGARHWREQADRFRDEGT